jgi:hypothetical protein
VKEEGPTLSANALYELRVKHLEMLQVVISRLAGYGVTLKNYCITLVTAICGFALSLNRPGVALLSLLPIAIFALLDAKYLWSERQFRGLFDRVRLDDWMKAPTFQIHAPADGGGIAKAFFSWSVSGFYLPLLAGVFATFILMGKWSG